MNYTKTGTKGKWIIENTHTAWLKTHDDHRSAVILQYFRNIKKCNDRGIIITDTVTVTEDFVIKGHGRKAIENIISLIQQGSFK